MKLFKKCPQCGFDENSISSQNCIICKADLALAAVVRQHRKLLPKGIVLLITGLAMATVGMYLFFDTKNALGLVFAFPGLILAAFETGLERGGRQRLWKNEKVPA